MIFLTMLLYFSSPSAHATTGVRNGGSAVDCPNYGFQMMEYLLAQRYSSPDAGSGPSLPTINDRQAFFDRAIARLPDSIFKTFVQMRWEQYGDSVDWPEGSIDDYEIYYYRAPSVRTRYGADGRIPALNPSDPVCSFPPYEPEICCPQVLVSFFGEDSPKPTKIAAHYARFDRMQRNVLELHEAVFRAARDLGQLPAPAADPYVQHEIDNYLKQNAEHGELPSTWAAVLVSQMISSASKAEIEAYFGYFWSWSSAIYGPTRKP
ncbi:MAG: hypothetical protein JST04_16470 [Bdellovibrionales bacterium]|nr:hypothetical protein [Bdellovibrionales bacterium]